MNRTIFKKSLKYFIIAAVNLVLLKVLLLLWTDKFELIFNDLVRFRESLKIIGITILSLIAMRTLVSYFRHKAITNTGLKIKIAVVLTFLISSYLYVDYTSKILSNGIINRSFRNKIAGKIKPSDMLSGTKGANLTLKEYQQIIKIHRLPELPAQASNIQYSYSHEPFLSDYLFEITYDLPVQINVDTVNYQKGRFSKYQSFEIIGNIKRVTYSEGEG